MKIPKLTQQNIFDLIDRAKGEYKGLSKSLSGMERELSEPEQIALSYFLASLTIMNSLTGERISDKVSVEFEEVEGSSIYDV